MSFRSTYRCGERRESHRGVCLCMPSGRKNQTHPPCMRGRLQREPSRAMDGNRAASGAVSVPAFAFVTDSLLHRGFRERLCLPGRISFQALHPRPPCLPVQAPFLPLVPPLPISPFGEGRESRGWRGKKAYQRQRVPAGIERTWEEEGDAKASQFRPFKSQMWNGGPEGELSWLGVKVGLESESSAHFGLVGYCATCIMLAL